jgi:hypothetical protein
LPHWKWEAIKSGLGYEYKGTKDDRCVRIHAVAVLAGWIEDDCVTDWRVQEGERAESYPYFWLRERIKEEL